MQAQILGSQADLKAVLARLNMNRRNASKPPVGGQKGHLGSTLCQAQEVDAGVIHAPQAVRRLQAQTPRSLCGANPPGLWFTDAEV
jgi:hypothetical protein